MISKPTTVEQIDAWRKANSETEKLEFKEAKNQFDFKNLLEYCVALANERGGRLLLGIRNKLPRRVVGTGAYPNIVKIQEDLFHKLQFRVDVEEVQHPDGRVLVFHIPSRPTGHPYHLDGSYYMRSGESLVAMTPDQLKQIFNEESLNKPKSGRTSPFPRVLTYILAGVFLSGIGLLSVYSWIWHRNKIHLAEKEGAAYVKDNSSTPPRTTTPPSKEPSQALPEIEVSFGCTYDPDALPIKVPPGSVGRVFFLNRNINETIDQAGLYEIPNFGSEVPKQWPDPAATQKRKEKNDQALVAVRCEAMNHGQQDLLELRIPIQTRYGLSADSPQLSDTTPWVTNTIVINPLDRGQKFAFYALNECPVQTQILIPHVATAKVVGAQTARRFELELENPGASSSQTIGIGPVKSSWRGVGCDLKHEVSNAKSTARKNETNLEIRFSEQPPYRWEHGGQTHIRLGLYNVSHQTPAENVQLSLMDIEPKPRDTQFVGDFPFHVYPATSPPSGPVLINPDAEELFEIAMIWKGGEPERFIVGGLGKQPGSYNMGIFMNRDEVWHLHLRVTAANTEPFNIELEIRTENAMIQVKKL